jgi:hypothetical protein
MKPNNIEAIASRTANKVKQKDAGPRNRHLHILVKFDRTNGYDEVAPLLRALSKRRATVPFVREAIIKAVSEAVQNA